MFAFPQPIIPPDVPSKGNLSITDQKKETTPMFIDEPCYNSIKLARKGIGAGSSAVNVNTNPPSDLSIQREYFLVRLSGAQSTKNGELVKLYNLFTDNSPKSPKDLIAAIEGKKYKLDEKKLRRVEENYEGYENPYQYHGSMYFFIWDGPQPDRKGYETAQIEMSKEYNAAKDSIMAGDAVEMKKAVEAFEEWLPKQKKH